MYSSIKNILLVLSTIHTDDRHNGRRKDDDGDSMKVPTN